MKKILALVLAALMVCALCATAFAAPADLTGHTYTAYQIFSGAQAEGEPELADIAWGSDIDSAALLAALKASDAFGNPNPFADCDSAFTVSEVLGQWTDGSNEAKAFAKIAYNCINGEGRAVVNGQTEIDAGYYLVVDTTEDVPVGDGSDVYNLALLQQTQKGTFEIATKVDVPDIGKKVSDASGLTCTNTDKDHVHTKDCYNWADSNNVAIGDTVLFTLNGNVPAKAVEYDYYFYIIGDKLSEGLTFTEDSISVTIAGEPAIEGEDYNVRYNEDGYTFEIALTDAKANAGQAVSVFYAAVLNENAIIGSTGNPNEVDVTFSNKPTEDYDGKKDDEGFPADREHTPLGETPKDLTLTFTTALKLYKVDQDGNPLEGVEFTLTGQGMNIVLIARDTFAASASGDYWKLANGTYTKEAPIAEDYMEPAEAGATEGYVVAENGYTGDATIVNGITYRPYNPSRDAGKQVYVWVKNNVASYDSTTTKYTKTVVMESSVETRGINISAYVDDMGIVILQGLNAGDYVLTETKWPDGYNPIDPIEFTITCDLPDSVVSGEETCTWEVETESDITYNEDNDAFEITIVNQKGAILPETGGIGTTIFYVLGALLVVGAVVLLVVKKRMKNEG